MITCASGRYTEHRGTGFRNLLEVPMVSSAAAAHHVQIGELVPECLVLHPEPDPVANERHRPTGEVTADDGPSLWGDP